MKMFSSRDLGAKSPNSRCPIFLQNKELVKEHGLKKRLQVLPQACSLRHVCEQQLHHKDDVGVIVFISSTPVRNLSVRCREMQSALKWNLIVFGRR